MILPLCDSTASKVQKATGKVMGKAEGKEPTALENEASLPISWKSSCFLSSELVALPLLASGEVGAILVPTVVTSFLCPTGEGSRQLLDAKVKLISNTVCNSRRLYDHTIDESMICAGNLQKPGQDSCQVRASPGTWRRRGWQDLTLGTEALKSPGLGSSFRGPPALKHRHRQADLNPRQSKIARHGHHSGPFPCIDKFNSHDTLVRGGVDVII